MKERDKLKRERHNIVIVHYACSSIDDRYPIITSISTYDSKLNLPTTFSRENETKKDEINILEAFFNYISKKVDRNSVIVGWNWSEKYGIKALISRYEQITGKRAKIKITKIKTADLLKKLTQNFSNFVGGMEFLAQYNGLNLHNFIKGKDEIKYYFSRNFEKLNNSTSAKVGIIYSLLQSYVDGNIQIPDMEDLYYRDIEPYEAFKENLEKIKLLIDIKNFNIRDNTLGTYFRNLLFVNVITILETYLSDTFITTVVNDKKLLKKYIEKSSTFNETLSKKKLYEELFKSEMTSENYVKNKCREDIKNITFHNMNKASPLYKNVLGITFPDITEIRKGISIRHDLVHRNGKDKNDKLIKTSLSQLKKLIKNVDMLVDFINKKIV